MTQSFLARSAHGKLRHTQNCTVVEYSAACGDIVKIAVCGHPYTPQCCLPCCFHLKNTSMLSEITPGCQHCFFIFFPPLWFSFLKSREPTVSILILDIAYALRRALGEVAFSPAIPLTEAPRHERENIPLLRRIFSQVTSRTLQWSVDSAEEICHLEFIRVKNESAKCHHGFFHMLSRSAGRLL